MKKMGDITDIIFTYFGTVTPAGRVAEQASFGQKRPEQDMLSEQDTLALPPQSPTQNSTIPCDNAH